MEQSPSEPGRLHKFPHGFADVDEELWTTGGIFDRGVHHIDAQIVIGSADDFLHVDWTADGVFAKTVRGSDCLSGSHTAASHQSTAHLRPVVSAGTVVDSRCASEFTPYENRYVIEHAAFFQIQHQGADGLIQLGPMVADEVEILAMTIPSTV